MSNNKIVVRPTYDGHHYRTRADYYTRVAEHEPDPVIRSALQAIARECREKAESVTNPTLLDC
jgi:hypothetical protein